MPYISICIAGINQRQNIDRWDFVYGMSLNNEVYDILSLPVVSTFMAISRIVPSGLVTSEVNNMLAQENTHYFATNYALGISGINLTICIHI